MRVLNSCRVLVAECRYFGCASQGRSLLRCIVWKVGRFSARLIPQLLKEMFEKALGSFRHVRIGLMRQVSFRLFRFAHERLQYLLLRQALRVREDCARTASRVSYGERGRQLDGSQVASGSRRRC